MNKEFITNYFANFCAGLSVLVVVYLIGLLSKARIIRSVKKFVSEEVKETIEEIKNLPN